MKKKIEKRKMYEKLIQTYPNIKREERDDIACDEPAKTILYIAWK